MSKEEKKEMKHLKELLKRLQEAQYNLYGNPSVTLDIDMNGYKHAIGVYVHIGVDMESTKIAKRNEYFTLAPWKDSRRNEDVCNGILALVKHHANAEA